MPRTTANPVKAAYEKVVTAFDKLPGKHVRFRDFSADDLDGVSEVLRALGGEPEQIASFIGAGDNFTTVNYYPEAKIFGLTTGLAVMKINSELGYEPVTYSELSQDEAFWAGCKSCVNYDILMSKERKNCMCTAMLYDPADHYEPEETKRFFEENKNSLERLLRFKEWKLLRPFLKKSSGGKSIGFLHHLFNR